MFLLKLSNYLKQVIKDWNSDERNRDKTVVITKHLSETKTEILDTMDALIERDGKINTALAKAESMKTTSTTLRKHAT